MSTAISRRTLLGGAAGAMALTALTTATGLV